MKDAPSATVRWPGVVGAASAGVAVAAGAFGAHALADVLTPQRLATFETAVRYQLMHSIALISLQAALSAGTGTTRRIVRAATLLALGTAVFSGSLYGLVASGLGAWGAVAPVGGAALIAGWAAAAWAFAGRTTRG